MPKKLFSPRVFCSSWPSPSAKRFVVTLLSIPHTRSTVSRVFFCPRLSLRSSPETPPSLSFSWLQVSDNDRVSSLWEDEYPVLLASLLSLAARYQQGDAVVDAGSAASVRAADAFEIVTDALVQEGEGGGRLGFEELLSFSFPQLLLCWVRLCLFHSSASTCVPLSRSRDQRIKVTSQIPSLISQIP